MSRRPREKSFLNYSTFGRILNEPCQYRNIREEYQKSTHKLILKNFGKEAIFKVFLNIPIFIKSRKCF